MILDLPLIQRRLLIELVWRELRLLEASTHPGILSGHISNTSMLRLWGSFEPQLTSLGICWKISCRRFTNSMIPFRAWLVFGVAMLLYSSTLATTSLADGRSFGSVSYWASCTFLLGVASVYVLGVGSAYLVWCLPTQPCRWIQQGFQPCADLLCIYPPT
jgi:hypothetical protein